MADDQLFLDALHLCELENVRWPVVLMAADNRGCLKPAGYNFLAMALAMIHPSTELMRSFPRVDDLSAL
jgi:hypothetical protein